MSHKNILKNQKIKIIFILVIVTFFAYFSSLGNPFIWDDEQFITRNAYVQSFDIGKIFTQNTIAGAGQLSNYYRPLTSLSFAIDKSIWGQNPFGFHLTNVTLHIGAGIFLFLFLTELGMGELGAFFVSLFFLIFPTQTEAVSYINSRGDSMMAFFLLGSLLLFVLALRQSKSILYICSAVFFACSILGKETALFGILLFPIVFTKYAIDNNRHLTLAISRVQLVFFISMGSIAGIYFLLRMTVLNFQNTLNYYTIQTEYSTHILYRIFTFCKILFVYLGMVLFPYPLHMERSVALVRSPMSWWALGAIVFVLGLLALAVCIYRKTRNFWLIFGFLWSSVFMLAISGIIPLNGLLYEHWLYLPMIGFWIMAYGVIQFSIFIFHFSIKSQNTKYKILHTYRQVLISFAIMLASLYIVLTIRQNNIWSDPVTFYSYTLQFAPNSIRLHNNLGMSLADRGEYRAAIIEYKKSIALDPNSPEAYNNLGNAYGILGDYVNAEVSLRHALKLAPQFEIAKSNLLRVYLLSKQFDKARKLSNNDPQIEVIIKQLQSQQR